MMVRIPHDRVSRRGYFKRQVSLKKQMGLGPEPKRCLLETQLEPSPNRLEKEARMSQEGWWVGLKEKRGVPTRALHLGEHTSVLKVFACSAMQSCLTLQSHGLQPARLLCLWNFPGKNTGVGFHFLLQEINPTQILNLCLLQLLAAVFVITEPPGKPREFLYNSTQIWNLRKP